MTGGLGKPKMAKLELSEEQVARALAMRDEEKRSIDYIAARIGFSAPVIRRHLPGPMRPGPRVVELPPEVLAKARDMQRLGHSRAFAAAQLGIGEGVLRRYWRDNRRVPLAP